MSYVNKKILFLVWYRGGSTLFESLLGKPWRIAQMKGEAEEASRLWNKWKESKEPFYLPTIPEKFCISNDITTPIATFEVVQPTSWVIHVGDWWGDLRGEEVKGSYEHPSASRWGPEEIQNLGAEWKVIFLVRNGKDQVRSLWNMPGGYEESRRQKDPDDYFLFLCRGFRNRARMALDSQVLENVSLFYAEDLFQAPIQTLEKMFDRIGLKLDKEKVSSFLHQVDGFAESWSSAKEPLTFRQQEIFWAEAGQELFELGYGDSPNSVRLG